MNKKIIIFIIVVIIGLCIELVVFKSNGNERIGNQVENMNQFNEISKEEVNLDDEISKVIDNGIITNIENI